MLTATDGLPESLQAMLREHLADPSIRLSDLETEPMPDGGYSGNRLLRARLAWTGQQAAGRVQSASWVVKRWLPGGPGERQLGIGRSLEALAWRHGLVRPAALPSGVAVPIVGALPDPDGRAAWIAMEDVASALDRYSRHAPLPHAEALARARVILDRLARLHVRWERPERLATLRRHGWLVPMERYLWCDADRCAAALGRPPLRGMPPGCDVTDEFRANVAAIRAWIPAGDRPLFERLFWDRVPLVSALRPFPPTLLHGDVGDRNLGLRPDALGTEEELVLIDWEWIGCGTPALDVARLWGAFPVVHDLSAPFPDAVFSDELPMYYFERYRSYGGTLADPGAWRRACGLALIGLMMSQLDFFGAMIRHDVRPVLAGLARQFDTVAATARALLVR